jgi:aspartate 1-decarboxylase
MLFAKIHRATVTETDLNYVGSITIDKELLDATGILPNEKVEIYDIDNGNRFATYVIEGAAGSGVIGVNGAAARLVRRGDKVIIVNFVEMHPEELKEHNPTVVIVDDQNKIVDHK